MDFIKALNNKNKYYYFEMFNFFTFLSITF